MFLKEDVADPQLSNKATNGIALSVLAIFRTHLRADSRALPTTSEERPEMQTHGSGFASCSRGLVFPDGDIVGPNSNTTFDPSIQYSTGKVVLSWRPPSYLPP